MVQDKAFSDALDKIDGIVTAPHLTGLDPAALCNEYLKIKPMLAIILPFIGKIPVYGSKIAAALTFLMGLADSLCPVAPKA